MHYPIKLELKKMYKKHMYDAKSLKAVESGNIVNHVDSPLLYQPIPTPVYMPEFEVSTDSGAHTLYKSFFVQGAATQYARLNADYSYLETPQFKKFLDDYIQDLLDKRDIYTFYVTLDIINNPEASWKITKYIESFGLHPIPVFHNGEDIYWLKRMLDEYPYIGISGLGQDITKSKFKPFGDACFKEICDSHGTPRAKIHGFAMGTPEILAQYPWYSADQSTWTYMSRVGSLLVPRPIIKNKEIVGFDHTKTYLVLPVTQRRRFEPRHVNHIQTGLRYEWLQLFAAQNGFTIEEAEQFYHIRDTLNIRLFANIQQAMKKLYAEKFAYGEGGNILFAGTPAGSSSNLSRLCRLMYEVKLQGMHWLGTPVYPKHRRNLITLKQSSLIDEDFRVHWDQQEASLKTRKTATSNEKRIIRRQLANQPKTYQVVLETSLTVTAKNELLAKEQAILQLQNLGVTATPIAAVQIPTPALPETPELPPSEPTFENYL